MADSGCRVTFGELEATSNQGAQLFRTLGSEGRRSHRDLMLENHPRFLQICWAAQRAGLYYTAISWRLQQQEVEYIVNNCEARVFITSSECRDVARALDGPNSERRTLLHDRRGHSRLRVLGDDHRADADATDRRSDRRSVDAVLVRHDRLSEGHQTAVVRSSRSVK